MASHTEHLVYYLYTNYGYKSTIITMLKNFAEFIGVDVLAQKMITVYSVSRALYMLHRNI